MTYTLMEQVVARIVARLHDMGWRHIPRPEPITRPPARAVPPNDAYRAARAALNGDTDG